MKKILGSFRDPSATVFELNNKIIRAIYKSGEKKFHHLISTRILEESVEKDFLIGPVNPLLFCFYQANFNKSLM